MKENETKELIDIISLSEKIQELIKKIIKGDVESGK